METIIQKWDLDSLVFQVLGENGTTDFTSRDACNNICILGGIGSGKSSSSGALIARKYIQSGAGGLVLCAKNNEANQWLAYAKEAGRENDIIHVRPDGKHYFNFLEYESSGKSGLSYTENIFQILKTVVDASEEKANGKVDDQFWSNALEQLMRGAIALSKAAYSKVSVQSLYDIAQSAPKPGSERKEVNEENPFNDAFQRAKENVSRHINSWMSDQDKELFAKIPPNKLPQLLSESIPEVREFENIKQLFFRGLYGMGDKTRSIIDFCFTGFLMRLLQEPVYSLFCNNPSTFTPEDCFESGKIILLDIPVKAYQKIGQDAQILVKYCWMRAAERRNLEKCDRLCFLWQDEGQLFLTPHDADFQTTARSCNISTVFITQNINNLYANMGGAKSDYKVKSFLGTLSTKIFHANACIETNNYASQLIGKDWMLDETSSRQFGQNVSISKGSSYRLEDLCRPEIFGRLKQGGPLNGMVAEAFIHMQGKTFPNGYNHYKIRFNQKP